MTIPRQLPLAVGLRDDSSFDSFLPTVNGEALAAVRSVLAGREPYVYLYGANGSGRTHLLEAAIAGCVPGAGESVYLALAEQPRPGPGLLEGLARSVRLICMDDVDAIAGDRRWEEAVFHLFNDARAQGTRLLLAADCPPGVGRWQLPDLRSRLASGLVVSLQSLADTERLEILCFRAARRGLELPPETAKYLLARVSRRLDDLVALLARLDREALAHQRRLTIPFVRQVLLGDGQGEMR